MHAEVTRKKHINAAPLHFDAQKLCKERDRASKAVGADELDMFNPFGTPKPLCRVQARRRRRLLAPSLSPSLRPPVLKLTCGKSTTWLNSGNGSVLCGIALAATKCS